MKKLLVASVCATAISSAFAAGFGLYESSARGVGMGNGLVGSTGDASANYYNPANLTECTNIQVMVGMSLINPFCDVKVDGKMQSKMNPGWFPPPHAYIAAPVWGDFFFGFGTYCEYGLGTKYDNNWALKADTTETTIQQFTFNPNIAYKINDDWSVSFGARLSYMTFENFKTPLDGYPSSLNPQLAPFDGAFGRQSIRTKLEGDDLSCGYVIGTQYKVNEKLRLGLVYRSRINHRVEGDFDVSGKVHPTITQLTGGKAALPPSGKAHAKLVLPASLTFGANYDFTKNFRGGASITWTEWSTINHIDFRLPAPSSRTQMLNWHDAWRLGFGFEYDFTKNLCGRIGYSYDWDPSGEAHGTTMLPPGDRHIVGFGVGYKFLDNWRVDLGYNFIIMESESRMVEGHKFQCDNSYSHIVSASVSYSF